MKIAIAGSPKAGKTTFSKELKGIIKHTDDLIPLGWSEASELISFWFDEKEVDVVEGVAVLRALRKWLKRNKENKEKPVEKILYFSTPYLKLTPGQERMAKGNMTVWEEIKSELEERGVKIEFFGEKIKSNSNGGGEDNTKEKKHNILTNNSNKINGGAKQ